MAASDSLVGEHLTPSPYKEAMARVAELEREVRMLTFKLKMAANQSERLLNDYRAVCSERSKLIEVLYARTR